MFLFVKNIRYHFRLNDSPRSMQMVKLWTHTHSEKFLCHVGIIRNTLTQTGWMISTYKTIITCVNLIIAGVLYRLSGGAQSTNCLY